MPSEVADDFITLTGIGRTFGRHAALVDVTLRLKPGRVGLLGPNGAGKSTLLKLLLGLIPPTSGTGRVLGLDLNSANLARLRQRVGFMPEADALVPGLSGVDYVSLAGELYGMPRRDAKRRAHEVLTYLDLEGDRYRKLEEYSTGMKQRLKLAQALVHDPELLLLDEPTSGLDPSGRDAMLRLLERLGRDHGKSLIVSTHLLGDVERVCEQVVILYGGRVRGQGGVHELCDRRHDRYRLQVQGDTGPMLEALMSRGVKVIANNGRGDWRVSVPELFEAREFFQLADQFTVTLRGLIRDDESLEELFYRLIDHAEADGVP